MSGDEKQGGFGQYLRSSSTLLGCGYYPVRGDVENACRLLHNQVMTQLCPIIFSSQV